MQIELVSIKGAPLISVVGEIDRANASTLQSSLADAGFSSPVHSCRLLDLTGLTFADSTIIAVIYDLLDTLPEDGWLGLIGTSPGLLRVLRIAGLLRQMKLRLFDSIDDAQRAL